MSEKPTYEELEQRIKDLEKEAFKRKQAEERLEESARLNELLLDSLPHPAMLINKKRIILATNKIAKDVGVEIGKLCWDTFGHCECISEEHKQRLKGNPNCLKDDILCTFCLANELIKTGTTKNDPEVSAFGKVWDTWWVPVEEDIYLHYAIDITERKRAEEALQESEEKYRQLFTTISDAILLLDTETMSILDINESALTLYGYSKDEFINMKLSALTAEPEKTEISIKGTISGEIKRIPLRYHKKKDGTVFPVEISSGLFALGNRKIVCGVMRDITSKINAEKALIESNEKARALLNATTDAAALLDKHGIMLDINNTYAQRFHNNKDELLGTCVWDLFPSEVTEARRANVKKVFETGLPINMTDERQGVWNFTNIYPVFDPDGKVARVAVFAHDITEQKLAEDELKKSREQLRELSKYQQSAIEQERTKIAREVHDDLGQTLTAIKMDLSWLKSRIHKNQKKLIKKAGSTIDLVDGTIRSVKRIISELRPGLLDDLGLAAAVEWQAEDFHNRTGIHVEVRISPSEFNLDNDLSTSIFRIFQESLTNVARHSQATEAKTTMIMKDNKIKLNVIDNGIGITEEQIAGRDSFGLMGIKERAHMFGGKVEISGVPGKGTTITVSFPV